MRRIREWMLAEEGRGTQWEIPLVAEAVVDQDGNRLFRSSELTMGTFEGWDFGPLHELALKIREFTGAFKYGG